MQELGKKHFRGILSNIDLSVINEDLIILLLNKNVIVDKTSAYDDWSSPFRMKIAKNLGFGETGYYHENSDDFCIPLFFNRRRYELNDLIIEDIYSLLEWCKEGGSYGITVEMDRINQKIDSFLDHDKKISFLNEAHEQLINEIPTQYYKHYLIYTSKANVDGYNDWRGFIDGMINNSNQTLLFYLKYKMEHTYDYLDQTDPELLFSKKYAGESILIRNWGLFYKTKKLQEYINKQLDKLQSSIQNQNKGKLTSMEQVVYIDKLRLLCHKFSSLVKNEKIKHLNNITGGKNYNEELQLNALEELVDLNIDEFEKMSDSQYGDLVHVISKTSATNLRKNFALFNLNPLRKDNINSEKDKKKKEKYDKAQIKIKKADDKLNSFF